MKSIQKILSFLLNFILNKHFNFDTAVLVIIFSVLYGDACILCDVYSGIVNKTFYVTLVKNIILYAFYFKYDCTFISL